MQKTQGFVKENFLLGYLSSLKTCLLCTFTCLVKWFSTFYSTSTTLDCQYQHFSLTIGFYYFLHLWHFVWLKQTSRGQDSDTSKVIVLVSHINFQLAIVAVNGTINKKSSLTGQR